MDRYLMCDRGFIQTSSMALSRTLAGKVRYREDVRFGDDTDFALRLSLAGARFLMTERPGTIWADRRSEEHTSELQSLMRISYAVFCLKKKKIRTHKNNSNP